MRPLRTATAQCPHMPQTSQKASNVAQFVDLHQIYTPNANSSNILRREELEHSLYLLRLYTCEESL